MIGLPPLGAMILVPTDPGTIIFDEPTGVRLKVTNNRAVVQGNKVYLTHRRFEEVKAKLQ